jgi:uncharacterized protein
MMRLAPDPHFIWSGGRLSPMKSSLFNYYEGHPDRSGSVMIYNTLRGSVAVVGRELRDRMYEWTCGDEVQPEERETADQLCSIGMVVPRETDELALYDEQYNTFVSDKSTYDATFILTGACNLACIYCVQEGSDISSHMDEDTCRRAVDWLVKTVDEAGSRLLEIIIMGGEALLVPHLLELTLTRLHEETSLRGIDFSATLITNGTLLQREKIEAWRELGLHEVRVTLDGDARCHNEHRPFRNGDGTFETIISKISAIADLVNLVLTVNLTNDNQESIIRLMDRLQAEGLSDKIEQMRFKPILDTIYLRSSRKGSCYGRTCSESKAIEHFPRMHREARKRGINTIVDLAIGPCHALREASVVINADGAMYKCEAFAGRDEFCVGHIRTGGFDGRHLEALNVGLFWECRQCNFMPVCGGGCRYAAFVKRGDYRGVACEKGFFNKVGREYVKIMALEE